MAACHLIAQQLADQRTAAAAARSGATTHGDLVDRGRAQSYFASDLVVADDVARTHDHDAHAGTPEAECKPRSVKFFILCSRQGIGQPYTSE